MKYRLLIVLLASISFSHVTIAQESINTFKGNWIFNYETSTASMDTQAKQFYEKMHSARQDKIRKVFKNRTMSFLDGGVFLQELGNGKKLEAKWSSNNGKIIDIKNASGHLIRFKVKRAENNVLVLIPIKLNGNNANKLFKEWYLTRS